MPALKWIDNTTTNGRFTVVHVKAKGKWILFIQHGEALNSWASWHQRGSFDTREEAMKAAESITE